RCETGTEWVIARRESAVERRDPDAGPAGDVLERDVQASLGEGRLRRIHDPATVSFGIGAERFPDVGGSHDDLIPLSGGKPPFVARRRHSPSTRPPAPLE